MNKKIEMSNDYCSMIVNNFDNPLFVFNLDGTYQFVNEAFAKLFGKAPVEIIGENPYDIFSREEAEKMLAAVHWVIKTREKKEIEIRVKINDGKALYYKTVVNPIKDEIGVVVLVSCVAIDITEHRQIRKELKRSEAKYRALFENAVEGIFQTTPEGKYINVNQTLANIFGYETPHEVIEKITDISNQHYVNPKDRERFQKILEENDVVRGFEVELLNKSGDIVWVILSAKIIRNDEGAVTHYEGKLEDITERKQAEIKLWESLNRLYNIMDNAGVVIYIKEIDGKYVQINRMFEELFHVKMADIEGKNDSDIFPREIADNFIKNDQLVIQTGKIVEIEEGVIVDDQEHIFLSIKFPLRKDSGEIYAICGISTDITERKLIEQKENKIEKLESLGVLAGGLAHDLNNMLLAIMGYAFLATDENNYEKRKEYLHIVLGSAEEAKNICSELMVFSKGNVSEIKLNSMAEVIKKSVSLALTHGSPSICKLDLPDDLWLAEFDFSQVQRVWQNLIINADQAMSKGGTISIKAENIKLKKGNAFNLDPGNFLSIFISDTGKGIQKKYLERIFDPFFSTKGRDGGNHGLGLSVAYSVITSHGGQIIPESKLGEGTTFHILFPASEQMLVEKFQERREIKTESLKIMFMDDQAINRDLMNAMLSGFGHTVILAQHGEEAIEFYASAMTSEKPFDLVILDLTIPGGMGGVETFKYLSKINPGVKVIISSGHGESDEIPKNMVYFLPKPFTIQQLKQKIAEVVGK